METLNRDCLSHIFLNLEFTERVRLEHVCRIWYAVLQQQSTFSDTFRLDIAKFLINNTTSGYYQQESISFAPTVMGIVERCGSYVQELTFGQQWLRISQSIVDCIASNCHRLRVIDLGAVILNADISPLLKKVAHQLEELSLEETSWVDVPCGNKVQEYFKYMRNLRRLNVRSAMFELNKLDELPTGSLRFIDVGGAHQFPADVFRRFLIRQPLLEQLSVSPLPVVDEPIIQAIGALSHLTHLCIGYSDQIDFVYDALAGLTQITTLKVQNLLGLTEGTFRHLLSAMTQLDSLTVNHCRNIRDYTALGLCSKLTSLEISDTMQFSDEDYLVLCTFGKLKRISFINCFNLTTRGVNIALTRCQLRELVVNRCSRVTDDMMYMLASTQRELQKISLQGCTGITSKGVSALAWLRHVTQLKEIDVARNRNVDDSVVISLHTALTTARQRSVNRQYGYDTDNCCHKEDDKSKLVMFIFETSVSTRIDHETQDLITLLRD